MRTWVVFGSATPSPNAPRRAWQQGRFQSNPSDPTCPRPQRHVGSLEPPTRCLLCAVHELCAINHGCAHSKRRADEARTHVICACACGSNIDVALVHAAGNVCSGCDDNTDPACAGESFKSTGVSLCRITANGGKRSSLPSLAFATHPCTATEHPAFVNTPVYVCVCVCCTLRAHARSATKLLRRIDACNAAPCVQHAPAVYAPAAPRARTTAGRQRPDG